MREEIGPELRAERNVAAVGHSWSLRMLVGVLAAVPFDELFARSVAFTPETGSVWRVELLAAAAGPLRTTRMSPL